MSLENLSTVCPYRSTCSITSLGLIVGILFDVHDGHKTLFDEWTLENYLSSVSNSCKVCGLTIRVDVQTDDKGTQSIGFSGFRVTEFIVGKKKRKRSVTTPSRLESTLKEDHQNEPHRVLRRKSTLTPTLTCQFYWRVGGLDLRSLVSGDTFRLGTSQKHDGTRH